jgi:signal transduction histidine kinase
VYDAIRSRPSDKPTILYQVDEGRSIRPSLAPEINAIVSEALRNSIRHAGASSVTVRGYVDFDNGTVEIRDNGRGFDPLGTDETCFGLIGMRERAERIGAQLELDSTVSGTSIVLKWGTP